MADPGGAYAADLASLRAIEEIKQLKARYFRGVDKKDAALLASAFCDDVVCDFAGGMEDPQHADGERLLAEGEVLRGATSAAAAIVAAVSGLVTVHHGMMPEIAVTSFDGAGAPDGATGLWQMTDLLRFPPDAELDEIVGWGFYHEQYRREADGWKISSLRLERLRVDTRRKRAAG